MKVFLEDVEIEGQVFNFTCRFNEMTSYFELNAKSKSGFSGTCNIHSHPSAICSGSITIETVLEDKERLIRFLERELRNNNAA